MIKAAFLFTAAISLTTMFVSGQVNVGGIETQFAQYRKRSFTEKVYIHTDRNYYLAGEILWWKLYYVDGYFHQPADLSKVVYVEVLDNNNKPVLQAKAALGKDGSSGSFYLPVSINSGNYTVRAYTNWMKNFGADYFFEKHVSIVNSMKALGPRTQAPVAYDARFFPEGGNLVRNIESRVGFRVTDQYGRGQDFSGALIDENNDTLSRFTPVTFGIGSFLMKPSGNHSYKAVLKLSNGTTLVRDLPGVFEQGYVMKLAENDGQLRVTVTSNISGTQQALLFVHTRQMTKVSERGRFQNGVAVFNIDKDKLGEGISHITVFDDRQQPVCERLYFKYPEQHRLAITASSSEGQYGSRKKVSLSVQTKTPAGAAPAGVSVAVYRIDSLQAEAGDDIQSYLWLTSDLKGTIESPSWYFQQPPVVTKEAMDNLMLTHGWRRFSWESIFTDSVRIAYQPEFDGHLVTGVVTNASTNRPAQGLSTYLSIPGSQVQFYPAFTDSTGRLQFDVRDYYGPGELVVQTDINSLSTYRVDITSPFADAVSTDRRPLPLTVRETVAPDITKASIGMQVQNVYMQEQLSKFELPDIDTLSFYGKHGGVYYLDDFVRFTTVEEVLREYVLEVGVRRRNGEPQLVVSDFVNKGFFTREPIILLDGVPVSHAKILAYDPLKIKKLQVIAARYLLGDFVYDGVVSFSTYRNNVENLQLVANSKTMLVDYEGLQLKREFFSPIYETEQQINNRLPDFRTLLYWSPDVKTNNSGTANVDFYTGDTGGKYMVVIEGMDAGGSTGSYSFTFDVKR
jgi:hypothetical protein